MLLALPLLACIGARPQPQPEGTLHLDQVFEHDGQQRAYHHYEPNAEGPRPLVLTLHGGGGKIDNHVGIGSASWPHQVWLDVGAEEGVHVLVPQGIDEHWNDCRADCVRCGEEDDIGFLLALLDELESRGTVDTSRVYVTGESNGGFMTQRLVQEAPERFAAGGPVIALQPAQSDCTPKEVAMPLMFQLGTEDAYIPYEGGVYDEDIEVLSHTETAGYWAGLGGCTSSSFESLPDLDPEDGSTVRREDYVCAEGGLSVLHIDGGGHVAPSVEVQVGRVWEKLVGQQNHDVEGVRVLWAFFQEHSRAR